MFECANAGDGSPTSVAITRAPSAANSSAVARPIPRAPPVINAIRPASLAMKPSSCSPSTRHFLANASINGDLGARNVAGTVRSQERHQPRYLVNRANASEWNHRLKHPHSLRVIGAEHRRVNQPRVNRIDSNLRWGQFRRGQLAHSAYRPLARRVG